MATAKEKVTAAQELLNVDELTTNEEEFDLVEGFLKAVENIEETTTPIEIRRDKKLFFKFNIHPITAEDMRTAQKKATTYIPDPRSKKLPKIEKDRNKAIYQSYIVYLATCKEDKAKLWDNPELKAKFGVMEGFELIALGLLSGEIESILDKIDEISGFDGNSIDGEGDKNLTNEELAKN